MKIYLLISLLLLSTLLHEVQGIRLGKGSIPEKHDHEIKTEDTADLRQGSSNGGVNEEVVLCKDGRCSSGMHRKIMTKTPSPSSPITISSKNHKNEGNKADPKQKGKPSTSEGVGREEEKFSVNSSPVSDHQEAASEHYLEGLDLAEMDYSPARRKSPIHN